MLIFEQFFSVLFFIFSMIGTEYFLKGIDFLSKGGIDILSLYSFVSYD